MVAPAPFHTLAELLAYRAAATPSSGGLVFVAGDDEAPVGWPALDRRARAIAGRLASAGVAPGARVLVISPPGGDFVAGLFGCLYAGAIAVPLYPPRPGRSSERFSHVLDDAGAAHVVVSPRQGTEALRAVVGARAAVVELDDATPAPGAGCDAAPVRVDPGAPAFLQYTSGSTAEPKGVIVTHRAILANLAQIAEAFGHSAASVGVNWLPPYHDMGLIGTLLQPLYAGFASYLLSPLAFAQRPVRWLQAISQYRATTAGAPNFALEVCVDRIRDADLAALDLSSVRVMFCGAEPIRGETLRRFVARFAPCGLDPGAMFPCYGLAEATLFVTGVARGAGWTSRPIGPAASARVSCGHPRGDTEVRIVDPSTRAAVPDGGEGEIWVRGPGVAAGYWQAAAATRAAFAQALAGDRGGWLRTGDLGAIIDGELYPSGRLKNVLIHDGKKLVAEDLEAVARAAVGASADHAALAFAVAADWGPEGIAIAVELPRSSAGAPPAWQLAGERIRAAVAAAHDVPLRAMYFVERGRLVRTSSGKLERATTHRALHDGAIAVLAQWDAGRGWIAP